MRPTHNISHQATSSNWPPKITAILHILVNMHSKLQTVYWDVHTTKCRTQKKQVEFLADLIILSIGAFTFVYGLLSSNFFLWEGGQRAKSANTQHAKQAQWTTKVHYCESTAKLQQHSPKAYPCTPNLHTCFIWRQACSVFVEQWRFTTFPRFEN